MGAYFEALPHQLTLAGASGDHGHLPEHTLASIAEWEGRVDGIYEDLRTIDVEALDDPAAEVTYGFLTNWIENDRGFRQCRMELWNVSPTYTGWQSEFALLSSVQPVATAPERQTALARFGELPGYLAAEIANLRRGLELGYRAPKSNVRAVIDQVAQLINADLSESPWVAMAPDGADDFRQQLEALTRDQIRPAIGRYHAFLRDEYLEQARDGFGVSENTNGEACYRAAIRYHATVDMTPQQVHDTGLEQMEIIHAQMREIGDQSFGTEDVATLLSALKTQPVYLFKTRQEIIDRAQGALDRAREAAPDWFGTVPSAEVVIEPYLPFQEATAPAGFYNPPAEDGSRPGIYLINTYQPAQQPIAGLESTAFHETYPGHHLQGAIALERPELHAVSRYIFLSGFGEGWGLYAERLAEEMGLFTSDVDRLGLLSAEAHRAGRLVVDTGLHALGWTRQEAIDYLLENTALSEALATAEIDRYIAVPGQATSYMLGNLEIRRLREEALTAFGDAFDIRAFHDRVLEDGPVPLQMLRAKIEAWIQG